MTTVILDSFYSVDSNEIWAAAFKNKWNAVRTNNLQQLKTNEDLFFYMGTERSGDLAKKLNCELISPALDWLVNLPHRYRSRTVKSLPWSEARVSTAPGFYKPADDKWFQAKIYESGRAIIPCSEEIDPNEVVIYSDPVKFIKEFRFFVLDRKPLTGSLYAIDGRISKTNEGWIIDEENYKNALEFVTQFCEDSRVEMPRSLVIDVGLLDYGTWAVVESNPSHAAGLYSSDPDLALLCIQAATVNKI